MIPRPAHLAEAIFFDLLHHDREYGGVEVEMQMAVHLVEGEAGGVKSFELGGDFGAELFAEVAVREITEPSAGGVGTEISFGINEARNAVVGQGGAAAKQGQVQADTESRILTGQFHGFSARRFVDHEAGGGEDAAAVGLDDRLINARRTPEIIGVNNQTADWRLALHVT
jgi:hypothetical protein